MLPSAAGIHAQNPSEASVQSTEDEDADDGFDLALLEGEVMSSLQEMDVKSGEGMLSTCCLGHLHYSLCSTQLRLGAGWCASICYSNQTLIRNFMSSSLQMRHLSATHPDYNSLFQSADDVSWNASHAQPYHEAELSTACFRPWTTSVNALSRTQLRAQPRIFC